MISPFVIKYCGWCRWWILCILLSINNKSKTKLKIQHNSKYITLPNTYLVTNSYNYITSGHMWDIFMYDAIQ